MVKEAIDAYNNDDSDSKTFAEFFFDSRTDVIVFDAIAAVS